MPAQAGAVASEVRNFGRTRPPRRDLAADPRGGRRGERDRRRAPLPRLDLRIPKRRTGSRFAPFPEALKATEKALAPASARGRWSHAADLSLGRWPQLGAPIDETEQDVLADMTFSARRRTKTHSANPPERSTKKEKRRDDVVGIFPGQGGIARPIGAMPPEADDAWRRRRMQIAGIAESDAPAVESRSLILGSAAA